MGKEWPWCKWREEKVWAFCCHKQVTNVSHGYEYVNTFVHVCLCNRGSNSRGCVGPRYRHATDWFQTPGWELPRVQMWGKQENKWPRGSSDLAAEDPTAAKKKKERKKKAKRNTQTVQQQTRLMWHGSTKQIQLYSPPGLFKMKEKKNSNARTN